MNTKRLFIVALLALALAVPSFAQSNESDPTILTFDIGTTTIAASGAESGVFRIPKVAKIDSIYVTDLSGVTANSTDYIEVKFYRNNVAYGTMTSSATAMVAVTPRALTPTAAYLAAGDVIQFKLTKAGAGQVTTNLGVTMTIHHTSSGQ